MRRVKQAPRAKHVRCGVRRANLNDITRWSPLYAPVLAVQDLYACNIKGSVITFPRVSDWISNGKGHFCSMCGIMGGEMDELTGSPADFFVGSGSEEIHGNISGSSDVLALCSTCYEGAKSLSVPSERTSWLLFKVEQGLV